MKSNKPVFKIIEGGQKKQPFDPGTFLSAKAVKSRLMGVTGLVVHRVRKSAHPVIHIYQLFYFDAEEYGFDTYRSFIFSEDEEEENQNMKKQMSKMFGGLGSGFTPVTISHVKYMVNHYIEFNLERGIPLPKGENEYEYLRDSNNSISQDEKDLLMKKISADIDSETELINYFMMRYIGNDMPAAEWLYIDENLDRNILPFNQPCTLLRNAIEIGESGDTLCQSLIECLGEHFIAISAVETSNGKISSFKNESLFRISPEEATLILARENFVMVYSVDNSPEENLEYAEKLFPGALINNHENGILLTAFNRNNNHVKKRVYRLDDDVMAMILITKAGEMVISSSDAFKCALTCETLFNTMGSKKRPGEPNSRKTGAFRFSTPLIPPFLNSNFISFTDFVNRVTTT